MKTRQKHSAFSLILWAAVTAYIFWIFSNSMASGTQSSSISEKAARFLLTYVNKAGFTIAFDTFHFYVRKLAHFSEYALLGFLTILALHVSPLFQPVLNWCVYGFLPPFMDEGIQLFTNGRSASLRDCLIDISGFLTGSLIMYILLLIIADIHRKLHQSSSLKRK